jgi:hypothetical protein
MNCPVSKLVRQTGSSTDSKRERGREAAGERQPIQSVGGSGKLDSSTIYP